MIRLPITALISLLLAILLGSALSGCGERPPPSTEAAVVLPQPKILPTFQLSRGPDLPFGSKDLEGQWSLLFFGYTRCPDVCPTELYLLGDMLKQLEQQSEQLQKVPQVVFVSVDPQQDQPAAVQQYAAFYHPAMVGATAEQVEIDRLAAAMGVVYERAYFYNGMNLIVYSEDDVPEALKDSYLVNHSSTLFLINPEGALHAILPSPHQVDVMIRDLAAIQVGYR